MDLSNLSFADTPIDFIPMAKSSVGSFIISNRCISVYFGGF